MPTGELDELAGALAAFQAECPVIPKKQTAQIKSDKGQFSYSYAGLGDIAPVVMPLLAKHGLAFTALPIAPKGDRPPVLRGMLVHTSGQRVTGELPITGRTPQEIGSALTYARRYMIGCLTGVVTDDDDDGAAAERAARRPPVAPPVQRKRRARPNAGEGVASGSPQGPDTTPTTAEDTTDTPEAIGDAMRRALFGAIGQSLGPGAGREERLALCGAVIGREVASSTDLTRPEVSRVLDWLERERLGLVAWDWDPNTGRGRALVLDPEESPPEGES